MAVTKRSNTRKHPSAAKKTNTKTKKTPRETARTVKKKGRTDQKIRTEIVLLALIALCILLFLSNLGMGGACGGAISSFFFGMFGICAHAFPFLLFLGSAFYYVNRGHAQLARKLGGAISFYILFAAFMQLVMVGYQKGYSVIDYFVNGRLNHAGGGLVGGVILGLLSAPFGTVVACVLLIIGMAIAAIVATQRALLTPIRASGRKVVGEARKYCARVVRRGKQKRGTHQREPAEAQEEKEAFFLPGAAEGVSLPQGERELFTGDTPAAYGTDARGVHPAKPWSDTASRGKGQSVRGLHREFPEKESAAPSGEEEIRSEAGAVQEEHTDTDQKTRRGKNASYTFPPISLLKKGQAQVMGDSGAHLRETAAKLQQTLHNFGVGVEVTNVSCGPSVTRYEIQPEQGVKVSRIVNLADDIKLNLAAADIRIEAPIPGKAAVGIEVPNATNSAVLLRDLIDTEAFHSFSSNLAFAVGKDIAGKTVITDIARMPHLLIAGATGSGKSVCINTLIMSILYKADPEEVKFIMVDPKVVELSVYNGIPHLFIPVVTDPKKAAGALNWAVAEMTNRYNKFAGQGVRDLKSYNAKIRAGHTSGEDPETEKPLPQIVIIVDELADLMMVAPGEVEDAICRLAQLARAAGLHLIIATQRPSVNVITGLIKANMPSRIAFAVSSGVDSRTILDMNGAEKLLGKGDMLFYPQGYQKPARLQGSFVSDKEIHGVVEFIKQHIGEAAYDEKLQSTVENSVSRAKETEREADEKDVLFADAGRFIIDKDKASIGMLQRAFKIGFNRAARIMDSLSDAGVVGPEEGTKPRKILMNQTEFDGYLNQ